MLLERWKLAKRLWGFHARPPTLNGGSTSLSGLVEDDESMRRRGRCRWQKTMPQWPPSIAAASSIIEVEERGGNVQVLSLSMLTRPVEVSRLKSEPSRRTRHQMLPSQCALACRDSFVVSP